MCEHEDGRVALAAAQVALLPMQLFVQLQLR